VPDNTDNLIAEYVGYAWRGKEMEDATVRETEYGTLCTDLNGSIRACCAISGVKISLRSRVLSFTFYFVVLVPLHRYILLGYLGLVAIVCFILTSHLLAGAFKRGHFSEGWNLL
jgi:hypothetical protein